MKIVSLSVPFPGAKRPLEEGKKLGMWDFVLLEGEKIAIPPADVYVFAAWHQIYEQLLGLGGKVGILWTSSAGEMDFEPVEQEYLRRIREDPRISFVWFGDIALAKIYPEKGFYAPYPFDVDGVNPPNVDKKEIATLFCPTGPKKNILNQLLAMKLVQRERKLTLHTNVQGYESLLNDVRGIDAIRHEWLPQVEYTELLASAKVNLACSWCETFNYNVAEAAACGTISVISETIPLDGLVVKDPNNPVHIAERILEGCGTQYIDTLGMVREEIKIRNKECKRILGERLSAL